MGFLKGKRALIVGLLSNRSIAYGIAEAMKREGAELAFTYQMDKFQDRVTKLAAEFDSNIVIPCDVADDAQIDALFPALAKHWDGIDIIVHSVAFAPVTASGTGCRGAVGLAYVLTATHHLALMPGLAARARCLN